MNAATAETRSSQRTAAEVLANHIRAFAIGLDAILADYNESSILVTPDKTYKGLKDIGAFFGSFLEAATPEFWGAFQLHANVVESGVGYITWSSAPSMPLATDTLVVRDGRIAVQTFTPFGGVERV